MIYSAFFLEGGNKCAHGLNGEPIDEYHNRVKLLTFAVLRESGQIVMKYVRLHDDYLCNVGFHQLIPVSVSVSWTEKLPRSCDFSAIPSQITF